MPRPLFKREGFMRSLRYNWGILGLGNIAREFCENMKKIGNPYAVAARDKARAEAFAREFSAQKAYDSYDELLADPNVDIVYVATVNSQHYANVKASLLAGKHVFCEKAILGDAAQLRELNDIAQKNNLLLAEAMTIFHMPLTQRIKELVGAGEIGRLKFVSADLGSLKEDDANNRYFSRALGGGAMLDIGTYGLSWVCSFIKDAPQRVEHVMSRHPGGGADESWAISLASPGGVLASVNLTFRAKLPKRAIVAGERAYFEVYNYVRAERADLVFPDGRRETIEAGKTDDALLYEIENVERAVETGDYSICAVETTRRVVDIMDELLKQADN